MKLDGLAKKLQALKDVAFQEAITLEDGTKWIPRVPLLDIFVDLLDYSASIQLGQTPEPLSPEVLADVKMWAKRKQLAREQGILFTGISAMSKQLLESGLSGHIVKLRRDSSLRRDT